MANINFQIPLNLNELQDSQDDIYQVTKILQEDDLKAAIKEARIALDSEGSEYIFAHFDTFYSLLMVKDHISDIIVVQGYESVLRGCRKLCTELGYIIGNEDATIIDAEISSKLRNCIKMNFYLFVQFIQHFEEREIDGNDKIGAKKAPKKAKSTDQAYVFDKIAALTMIEKLLHEKIYVFWSASRIEISFINLLVNISHQLLRNPGVKKQGELVLKIFGVYGVFIKSYNYGTRFAGDLVYLMRNYEHVSGCIMPGLKMLVENYECRSLIESLLDKVTDWQSPEDAKECAKFVVSLVESFPVEVEKESDYILECLTYDVPVLRCAAITAITELLLKLYHRNDLNEEETTIRDNYLTTIRNNLHDSSSVVRAKVYQCIARLQQQNAIPQKMINHFLRDLVTLLNDKDALPRKFAIQCVTTFLEYNTFGGKLQLPQLNETLANVKAEREEILEKYQQAKKTHEQHLTNIWSEISMNFKTVLENFFESNTPLTPDAELDKLDLYEISDLVRSKLKEKNLDEICQYVGRLPNLIPALKSIDNDQTPEKVKFYIDIIERIFLDDAKIQEDVLSESFMSHADFTRWNETETELNFNEYCIEFVKLLRAGFQPMKKLIFSSLNDCSEVFKFFTAAAKFQLDNFNEGVLEMLKIYKQNNPDKNKILGDAFRDIYLQTDANNMAEHTTIIINRLFRLIEEMTLDQAESLECLIADWTAKGTLDNSVIDIAWKYFAKRVEVSNDESRAACEILRMCAIGRKSIILKNIQVVATIAKDLGKDDMLLLASSLRFLAVAGNGTVDITSKEPPFTISYTDKIFEEITTILIDRFASVVPFYSDALHAGIEFIFKVCSKPLEITENLIRGIRNKMDKKQNKTYVLIRFLNLIGTTAIHLLVYLDVTVHRELKRRNNIREENKTDVSVLEGAQAVDNDAEFILNVLENDTVTGSGMLALYTQTITEICDNVGGKADKKLQKASITALVRCMLVSTKLCKRRIALVFRLLSETTSPDIKSLILMHCNDLLVRFPNIVEPYSDQIYLSLKDANIEVRQTALLTLSNLILKDMIRPQSHLAEMAVCLIDEDAKVKETARTFYQELKIKDHTFENIIPDVFGHLARFAEVSDEGMRFIIKFLVDLCGKLKIEAYVERMLMKFSMDDVEFNRNLMACLDYVVFNDKALGVLIEKFGVIREHIHDGEIYAGVKTILDKAKKGKCSQNLIDEMDNAIAEVFENNGKKAPKLTVPKPGKKAPKRTAKSAKKPNKKRGRKQVTSESPSESD